MAHHVAAVIKDHVRRTKFIHDALKKLLILLRPDADFDLIFLVSLTFRHDIDSDNSGVRAKVSLPHLKRSAAAAAYFDERKGFINKIPEVTLINGKVMLPLVDQPRVIG